MADKLLIVMVNTDPANPSELSAPFSQATVAAAMGYEVEIVLSGRAEELARSGVAANLYPHEGNPRSLYELIKDAVEAGVRLKVCSPTLELWGDKLIPEITETVGSAYIISEAMDDNTVTFTY